MAFSAAADHAAETIASFAPPASWIEPCSRLVVDKPPKGDRWRHEVKWDRYRVCVLIDADQGTRGRTHALCAEALKEFETTIRNRATLPAGAGAA